jgi:GTP-binding protein
MQFIDEAIIEVASGHGGPGASSFMRQAHRPMMGPDGGDGGRGGHVYFQATRNLQSLLDFRFQPKYHADNGQKGGIYNKNGRNGEDLLVLVPQGTVIYDVETGAKIADIIEEDKKVLLAKGGRGGLGNMNFATPTKQAPEYAQPGEEGETRKIRLELKLLADVGLVGFPNAGKSTLISKISAAKPKIANYPFTTLVPNLGVVRGKGSTFVVADIPGLIEGANEGKGLGTKFLKHCERSRLLIVVLDGDPINQKTFLEEYDVLLKELTAFSETLKNRDILIAVNKADVLMEDDLYLRGFEELKKKFGKSVFLISAVSGQGIDELLNAVETKLIEMGPREWKNEISDPSLLRMGNEGLFE